MKKKEKSNKENRITLKMLWSHPFYNSLIKLGMWFLFFLILYIFLIAGRSTSNLNNKKAEENIKQENTKPKISYIDMKKNLINGELSITYNIGDYILTGLINNNVLTGTLEDNDNLYKIEYDGEKIYQVKKEEKNENEEILTDINKNYLLPSKIIEIIDDPKVIGKKSADELTYSYDIDGVAISFYLNEKSIEKIIILDGNITYNLEYKEVVSEK